VADSGFVFGAYTHCSWPADGTAADPTGKSFLFSLVNASGNAVRFSLRVKDRAIQLAGGIGFGGDKFEGGKATGYSNFILMFKGQAADEKDANTVNPLTAEKAYQPDDGQVRDKAFLAGQKYFAAAEIEVFQL
jgi:hypothetical protein